MAKFKEILMTKPWKLTQKNLDYIDSVVLNDKDYGSEYKIIQKVLKKYPKNDDPLIVALKICLIDTTNSTNLSKHRRKVNISSLASNIVNLNKKFNLDNLIKNGKYEAVELIAKQKINLLSFASKYCVYHNTILYNRDDYVIFDSIVSKNLYLYCGIYSVKNPLNNKIIRKYTFNNWFNYGNVLEKYINFVKIINMILLNSKLNLNGNHKKFDHFIWWQFRKK